MFQLVLKSAATAMMQDAYWWYEEQKEGLGEDFLTELESCFSKLKSHPQYFGKFKKNFRQVALKRFPYVVVFEIIKIEVVVFAVFHTKRNPKLKFK